MTTHLLTPAVAGPLYLHGGSFVIGGRETHDSLCRELPQRSGGAVVALDYRRAPKHPFPAAVQDAWAAMYALSARATDFGLAAVPIAVGGDSAGGTLAAVCALHARDRVLRQSLHPERVAQSRWRRRSPGRHAEGCGVTRASPRQIDRHHLKSQHFPQASKSAP